MLVFSSDRTAAMTHLHGMLVGEGDCSHSRKSQSLVFLLMLTLINVPNANSKRSIEVRQLLVAV